MNLLNELHQLHLLRPWWLLAVLPALFLTLALWRARNGGGDWSRAIAPELLQPLLEQGAAPARRRWLPLLLIGWLLATLALAGPAWQQLPQPVMQRSDALVIVLDLSLSMLTQDVTPSRLQRARFKIQDILAQRHEGTTALVAYAGTAHVVAPLTDDSATLVNLLPAMSPETMPVRGSNPAAAIELAIELLQSAGEQRGRILLISDGISARDTDAISGLLDSRWQLAILGIGTQHGAPLPLDGGFARNADGSIAVPKLSRAEFEALAQRSDGRYRELSADSSDIDALLTTSALDLEATRRSGDSRQFDQWHDRGALLALLLVPLAALLFRRGWLLLLPLLAMPLALLPAAPAHADEPTTLQQSWRNLWLRPDQQAARALDAGNAEQAAQQFADPRWRGAAHYRAGDYTAAAKDFADAQGDANNANADYNRGNALARAGKLQEALQAYDAALQANPQLDDASFNRQLVEQLLQQQSQQNDDPSSQQQPSSEQPSPEQQSSQQPSQQQPSQQQSSQQQSAQQASQQQQSNQGDNQQNPSASSAESTDKASADSQDKPGDNPPSPDKAAQDPSPAAKHDSQQQAADDEQKQTAAESGEEANKDDSGDESKAAASAENTMQQQRETARTEQWLQQIPDDPGGLLQRKFLYEQRLRERNGETRAADQPAW